MAGDGRRELATARLIVTVIYVSALVVFPMVGRAVEVEVSMDAGALRMLAAMLGVVGLTDYGLSLVVEQRLLARAREGREGGQNPVVTAAVVVGALGVSLAVYGLVLTLLGAPGWGAVFYVVCAAHGLHLIVRWPRYQRAAEKSPY